MGFDLLGRAPKSWEGESFRRSIWGWPPLVQLLLDLCPEDTRGCADWLYNEGDGLDDDGTRRLVRQLEMLEAEGSIDAYCREQNAGPARSPRVSFTNRSCASRISRSALSARVLQGAAQPSLPIGESHRGPRRSAASPGR
jgi:hypothetical protein